MTKKILDFYNSIETVTTQLVKMIVSIFTFSIGEIAPLAAPIAPAFSVYKALAERLGTPPTIALAGAIAIELVGIFISKTAIHCHNWNSARIKTEPAAPKGLAIAIAAIFFSVVFILSLTIEIDPELAILVYPGFVLIAITTYTALAVSNNLQAWERDRAERLAEQAEKRSLAADIKRAKTDLAQLAARANEVSQQVKTGRSELTRLAAELAAGQQAKNDLAAEVARLEQLAGRGQFGGQNDGNLSADRQKIDSFGPHNLDRANQSKQDQIEARRAELAALLGKNDQLTNRELADQLGVSLGTIKADKKALNGALSTK